MNIIEVCYQEQEHAISGEQEITFFIKSFSLGNLLFKAIELLDKDDTFSFLKIGAKDKNGTYYEQENIFMPKEKGENESEVLQLLRMKKTAWEWLYILRASSFESFENYRLDTDKGFVVYSFEESYTPNCCINFPVAKEEDFLKRIEERFPEAYYYLQKAREHKNDYLIFQDKKLMLVMPDVMDLWHFVNEEFNERMSFYY